MKLNFIAATLAATAVSALSMNNPKASALAGANNTTLTDVALEKRACSSITLWWAVTTENFPNTYTFGLDIDYKDKPYYSTRKVQEIYGAGYGHEVRSPLYKTCYKKDWCVEYTGWKIFNSITLHVHGKTYFYSHPSREIGNPVGPRPNYEYWDCI
ncbi:hypothetical protein BGZ95_011858 [Linnemannia exigua]|uniref:Uncharacterized protein n=1 Tax=Linnemannia exigua TaxID=604196 RepID=A0AAD4H654_9FUNG|nr:hypothetical protein BGZ95_011858 [Linnemannia exigua]